jgi:hypothetical protein
MPDEEKIIPRGIWKAFYEFWDNTEWKDLTKKDIKKNLGDGKYVFFPIPKNITDKETGTKWLNELKQFREKGKTKSVICFKGDKMPLEKVLVLTQFHQLRCNRNSRNTLQSLSWKK